VIVGKGARRDLIDDLVAEFPYNVEHFEHLPPEQVAEKMDAKELVAHLNAHFGMIGQAIEAEGGIVDKYVGDAVVAIFGALVPLPNHPAAAMRAALKVQERLSAEAGKEGAFKIRIGLNTGSCVVGNVGWIDRINYTAIGDPERRSASGARTRSSAPRSWPATPPSGPRDMDLSAGTSARFM
jgi:hypothetical protein